MTPASTRPFVAENSTSSVIWILRAGLTACFIGHGALGLSRVAAWTSYFGVVGISQEHAIALMPWVGAFDVGLALAALVYPVRSAMLYMAVWALWTAALRPLAGESIWELVERAGNYGVPFALYLLCAGASGHQGGPKPRFREALDESQVRAIGWVLRLTTVLLLFGHGALNLIVEKPMFSAQYTMICLPGSSAEPVIGAFECVLALAVLFKANRWLLFGVVVWKLATEALCPMAGSPLWVFVEHGGSYAAPLALAFLLPRSTPLADVSERATAV